MQHARHIILKAQVGDYIRHPDDQRLYRIDGIDDSTYQLDDGRQIGDIEIDRDAVLLESEAYDEFHGQKR